MTPEQLMTPRYKVIADYPFSEYKIGQVLRIDVDAMDVFYAQFPAIFRRMNWAEERKPEELPRFIKGNRDGSIYEVPTPAHWAVIGTRFTPSTEAEYLAQKQK